MNWKTKNNQRLIQAVLAIKTPQEAERFLRDLMTVSEIMEFANRLQAAELLAAKTAYATIIKKTGLSSTTVARVAKFLNSPPGGYKNILNKLHHTRPRQLRKGMS